MATEAPDPKTFQSWEDAFQYPVTTVRGMEKQLRGELDTNRERLRTLVGASYRDLLDTAERIIGMDEAIQQVESNLGSVSERCNSRLVERHGRNFDRWNSAAKAKDREHLAFVSLLAVLQDCPLTISRLLRRGDSTLLAAKVLVVSRRVHRTLSQHPECPPLVKSIHNQLASLWRKLLRHIDRQLSSPGIRSSRLVEVLCAYSLARSSSLTDTLKHFHHVRLEAITTQFEGTHADRGKILRALRLYSQTLQDTQAILPKPIMEALLKIKSRPLLKDADVRTVVELNLPVHERWMPDEIRQFIPWIGHDDLQRAEADRLLRSWADTAFSTLLGGLRSSLGCVQDFRALVQIRREVLETWFDGRNRVAVTTSIEPLEGLRTVMNGQLVGLIRARASRLHLVSGEVSATLQDWKTGITDKHEGLWGLSTGNMDVLDGAMGLRKAVLDRVHGSNDAVLRVMGCYHTWLKLVEEAIRVVKELRDQKWDEDLDDDDDDFGLESRQAQLSGDDPDLLEREMKAALTNAFGALQQALSQAVGEVKHRDGEACQQAAFLIRVIREIRQRLPQHGEVQSFGLSLSRDLQSIVCNATTTPVLQTFRSVLDKRPGQAVQGRALWEGSPALPVQPSPAVFQLLHGLVTSMEQQGTDLWSPSAARTLKEQVHHQVLADIQTVLSRDGQTQVNGDNTKVNGSGEASMVSVKHDRPVQTHYDVLFLQEALSSGQKEKGHGATSVVGLALRKAAVTPESRERLEKSAREYWKRTRLLFTLLA